MSNDKRKDLYELIKRRIGSQYLPFDQQCDYYRRLITPYYKNGNQLFIQQYINGSGNELEESFWSINSSSRFAFELYSWMVKEDGVKVFEFEKKLDTINHAPIPPNMDVYIEIDDRVIFIESKFREKTPQKIDDLSESYYSETTTRSKQTLYERYKGDKKAADTFRDFAKYTKRLLEGNNYPSCWMNFKQEITHLIGIALTIRNNPSYYKNKRIEFYNVYYDFGDKENTAIEIFFKEANKIMNNLLDGIVSSFKYEHITAQSLVKNGTIMPFDLKAKAFASDKTIGEFLDYYFNFVV